MIEAFKILKNKYDYNPENLFIRRSIINSRDIRGHSLMLYKKRTKLNIRKYSFAIRVVDMWNSLPPSVINATSVMAFERKLDKFWSGQAIKFDHTSTVVTGLNLRYPDEDTELVPQE